MSNYDYDSKLDASSWTQSGTTEEGQHSFLGGQKGPTLTSLQREGVTDASKLCSLLVLSQALTAVLKKYEDNKTLIWLHQG